MITDWDRKRCVSRTEKNDRETRRAHNFAVIDLLPKKVRNLEENILPTGFIEKKSSLQLVSRETKLTLCAWDYARVCVCACVRTCVDVRCKIRKKNGRKKNNSRIKQNANCCDFYGVFRLSFFFRFLCFMCLSFFLHIQFLSLSLFFTYSAPLSL